MVQNRKDLEAETHDTATTPFAIVPTVESTESIISRQVEEDQRMAKNEGGMGDGNKSPR